MKFKGFLKGVAESNLRTKHTLICTFLSFLCELKLNKLTDQTGASVENMKNKG